VIKFCANCNREFETRLANQAYCKKDCRDKATGMNYGKTYGLNSCQSGALSELIASADLMKRGYEVFRALSQACSCDLIALKDGICYRVEVKTGTKTSKGVSWSEKNKHKHKNRYDIMVVVVKGEPHYIPDISTHCQTPS
jgi:Holliday junction resolvase-like predicted endonuclease